MFYPREGQGRNRSTEELIEIALLSFKGKKIVCNEHASLKTADEGMQEESDFLMKPGDKRRSSTDRPRTSSHVAGERARGSG